MDTVVGSNGQNSTTNLNNDTVTITLFTHGQNSTTLNNVTVTNNTAGYNGLVVGSNGQNLS